MDAVASSRTQRNPPDRPRNVNGAVRDEDTYVIGDDDEDPDSDCGNDDQRNTPGPPPVYQATEHSEGASIVHTASIIDSLYHIKHSDTLQGIAFKLRIDVSSPNNQAHYSLWTPPRLMSFVDSINYLLAP